MVRGDVRPKLKQDSVFFQGLDGVLLKSEQTTFFLRGKTVYSWLSKLSPYMTGEHSLDEICEGLDDERRKVIFDLIGSLIERGVVKDRIPEDPDLLPLEVRQRFRQQIEFVDHFADEAVAKFKRFRLGRVLLAGSGEPLRFLAGALARNGLEQIHLLAGPPADEEAIRREIASLADTGIAAAIVVHRPDSLDGELAGFDLLAYCSDVPDLRILRELNDRCIRVGCRFLPATVFAGKSMIGPLVEPGERCCWLCAALRQSSNASPSVRASLWQNIALGPSSESHGAVASPIARMMGNAQAFEIFKILAGHLLPETRKGQLLQDLETFESYTARLVAHPLCPSCSQAEPAAGDRLAQLVSGEADRTLEKEQLFRRFDRMRDFNLGILRNYDDDDLPQLPLKNALLVVGHPLRPEVEAWSIVTSATANVLEARCNAMAEAVLRYSRALPDRRQMLLASRRELEGGDAPPVAAERLATWNGGLGIDAAAATYWLPAWSLTTERKVYVPAAAVYPASDLNRDAVFERTEGGAGGGLTFAEVKTRALTAALGEELLAAALARPRVMRIDPAGAHSEDPDLEFLVRCALRYDAGLSLCLLETDGPAQVAVAFAPGEGESAPASGLGFGLSRSAALIEALTRLVGDLGLRGVEGLVREGEGRWREAVAAVAEAAQALGSATAFEERAATFEEAAASLAARGMDALFVHLTTPDIWETKTFISGCVLLART